jgi:hypothetical protein
MTGDLMRDVGRWENGELTFEEECHLFQHLVNTGDAWKLQGYFGRHAAALIDAGYIREPKKESA